VNVLRRLRPSPAIVIGCVALTVALGGTGYAAIERLPRDSVTTVQVKNFSLLNRDFKRGEVPAGPAGPPGPGGPAGPAGAAGPVGPAGSANVRWALVKADGTVLQQSGGVTVQSHTLGNYIVDFNEQVTTRLVVVSPAHAGGDTAARGATTAGPCGATAEGSSCSTRNDTLHVLVRTFSTSNVAADHAFYVAAIG
jgi:hypothetical protein